MSKKLEIQPQRVDELYNKIANIIDKARQMIVTTINTTEVYSKFEIHTDETVEKYDIATEVVGVIRIRIDRVFQWLGNGKLLTQENLFPAPGYDTGYDVWLQRTDIFTTNEFKIAKYII